jgi:hypothetical protein
LHQPLAAPGAAVETGDTGHNADFIDEYEPFWIRSRLPPSQGAALGRDVWSILFDRVQAFFKSQFQMTQKPEDRSLADRDLPFGQFSPQFSQRDMRLLCHPLPDQFLMRRQSKGFASAELCQVGTARAALELEEPDDRTQAYIMALGSFRAGCDLRNRLDHA